MKDRQDRTTKEDRQLTLKDLCIKFPGFRKLNLEDAIIELITKEIDKLKESKK